MREVFYRNDAINWVWYGTFILDDETGRAISKGDSYRLHKWDEGQGANDHKPTTECFDCQVYNGGGPNQKKYHCLSVRRVSEQPHPSIPDVTQYVYSDTEYFVMCDVIDGVWYPRPVIPMGMSQSFVDRFERQKGTLGTAEEVAQWEALDEKEAREWNRKIHREDRPRDKEPVADEA